MEKDEIGVDFLGPEVPEEVDSSPAARPFLSFSILPGFKCFFKQSVLRENISLQDCYERVMKDHFFLQKTRKPTAQLFSFTALNMGQRSRELYFRSLPSEKFYIQSGGNPIYRYSLGKDKEEQLSHLERQLELYRRSGEEALTKKKKQLKNLRQEQQLMRVREEEEKNRRSAVLDRLKVDKQTSSQAKID